MFRGVGHIALGLSLAVFGAYSFVRGAVPLVVDVFLSHQYVDEAFAQFMALAMVVLSALFLLAGVRLIRRVLAARQLKHQSHDAPTPP